MHGNSVIKCFKSIFVLLIWEIIMINVAPYASASMSNRLRKPIYNAPSTSRAIAGSSNSSMNMPSTSAQAMYIPDYSTDYDSELAHILPREQVVNSSDTEDASEDGEGGRDDLEDSNYSGLNGPAIKEQVYLDKLEQLKSDLRELDDGTHPEFVLEFRKVEKVHLERERKNEMELAYNNQQITRDFVHEQRAAHREFEEKKSELKETLLSNLSKQLENIESERYANELSLDQGEIKPASTRNLRRRPNDPVPAPENKRRKTPQNSINTLLDESEIAHDLNIIRNGGESGSSKKGHGGTRSPPHISSQSSSKSPSPVTNSDTRIEDGKLFYEKRWFHRGQPIYLEGKEMLRIIGVISGISQDGVWVRKVGDNGPGSKLRVPLIHLMKGKCTIKRRA